MKIDTQLVNKANFLARLTHEELAARIEVMVGQLPILKIGKEGEPSVRHPSPVCSAWAPARRDWDPAPVIPIGEGGDILI